MELFKTALFLALWSSQSCLVSAQTGSSFFYYYSPNQPMVINSQTFGNQAQAHQFDQSQNVGANLRNNNPFNFNFQPNPNQNSNQNRNQFSHLSNFPSLSNFPTASPFIPQRNSYHSSLLDKIALTNAPATVPPPPQPQYFQNQNQHQQYHKQLTSTPTSSQFPGQPQPSAKLFNFLNQPFQFFQNSFNRFQQEDQEQEVPQSQAIPEQQNKQNFYTYYDGTQQSGANYNQDQTRTRAKDQTTAQVYSTPLTYTVRQYFSTKTTKGPASYTFTIGADPTTGPTATVQVSVGTGSSLPMPLPTIPQQSTSWQLPSRSNNDISNMDKNTESAEKEVSKEVTPQPQPIEVTTASVTATAETAPTSAPTSTSTQSATTRINSEDIQSNRRKPVKRVIVRKRVGRKRIPTYEKNLNTSGTDVNSLQYSEVKTQAIQPQQETSPEPEIFTTTIKQRHRSSTTTTTTLPTTTITATTTAPITTTTQAPATTALIKSPITTTAQYDQSTEHLTTTAIPESTEAFAPLTATEGSTESTPISSTDLPSSKLNSSSEEVYDEYYYYVDETDSLIQNAISSTSTSTKPPSTSPYTSSTTTTPTPITTTTDNDQAEATTPTSTSTTIQMTPDLLQEEIEPLSTSTTDKPQETEISSTSTQIPEETSTKAPSIATTTEKMPSESSTSTTTESEVEATTSIPIDYNDHDLVEVGGEPGLNENGTTSIGTHEEYDFSEEELPQDYFDSLEDEKIQEAQRLALQTALKNIRSRLLNSTTEKPEEDSTNLSLAKKFIRRPSRNHTFPLSSSTSISFSSSYEDEELGDSRTQIIRKIQTFRTKLRKVANPTPQKNRFSTTKRPRRVTRPSGPTNSSLNTLNSNELIVSPNKNDETAVPDVINQTNEQEVGSDIKNLDDLENHLKNLELSSTSSTTSASTTTTTSTTTVAPRTSESTTEKLESEQIGTKNATKLVGELIIHEILPLPIPEVTQEEDKDQSSTSVSISEMVSMSTSTEESESPFTTTIPEIEPASTSTTTTISPLAIYNTTEANIGEESSTRKGRKVKVVLKRRKGAPNGTGTVSRQVVRTRTRVRQTTEGNV